jgi:hypothetical protein
MKFIKGARPGLKRPSQVTATNAEKKCEKAWTDFQRKLVRMSSLMKICHDMYKVW